MMYSAVLAPKIIGEAGVNRPNESLGKIDELVIDAREGRLAYSVFTLLERVGQSAGGWSPTPA